MDKKSAYDYIRSRYVNLAETRKLIKTHGLKIKYGFLSESETATVKKHVEKFLKERGLEMKDLRRHLVEESEFPMHDLIYECTQACELRTFKSIHTHLAYMYNPFIHCSWNTDDELQLLDLVSEKGFRWKEISYHLSKYKDLCRLKYLALKGEYKTSINRSQIISLLNCMPSTDEEWAVLCTQLKQTKSAVMKAIEKYLKGKELKKSSNSKLEILLCLTILNNNHYCKFNVNINKITEYLDLDPTKYEIFDKKSANKTPFVGSKGRKPAASQEVSIHPEHDENEKNDYFEDEIEATLENIKKASAENLGQTRFLNTFLDYFNLDPSFVLDVNIDIEDIFWFNISKEINISKHDAVTKFNQLSRMYNWKTFKDIYDTVIKISYDHVVKKIKSHFVNQEENSEIPIEKTESLDHAAITQ